MILLVFLPMEECKNPIEIFQKHKLRTSTNQYSKHLLLNVGEVRLSKFRWEF